MFDVLSRTTRRLWVCVALSGVLAQTACVPSAVGVSAGWRSTPYLVQVAPGLWVVEDYDYPLFYSGGFYWYYYGNYWYRTPTWGGSWVYVPNARLPRLLVTVDPVKYRRYRAPARVRRYRVPEPRDQAPPRSYGRRHDDDGRRYGPAHRPRGHRPEPRDAPPPRPDSGHRGRRPR